MLLDQQSVVHTPCEIVAPMHLECFGGALCGTQPLVDASIERPARFYAISTELTYRVVWRKRGRDNDTEGRIVLLWVGNQ